MPKEDAYYVKPKEFYEQMYAWKKAWEKDNSIPLTEEIGRNILNIIKNFSYKKNFINYTYRDKMVTEALYTAVRYAHKWNEDHPSKNAFSYFTRIAWTSFVKEIKSEHKQTEMKKLLFDEAETGHFNEVHTGNNNHDLDKYKLTPEFSRNSKKFQPITIISKNGKRKTYKTEESYKKYLEKKGVVLNKEEE